MNPEQARETYAPKEEDFRCRGDFEADPCLLDYRTRLRAYKECFDSLRAMPSSVSHSLSNTLDRAIKVEGKRLRQARNCQAQVFAKMEEILESESKKRRIFRQEYQKAMTQAKEKFTLH